MTEPQNASLLSSCCISRSREKELALYLFFFLRQLTYGTCISVYYYYTHTQRYHLSGKESGGVALLENERKKTHDATTTTTRLVNEALLDLVSYRVCAPKFGLRGTKIGFSPPLPPLRASGGGREGGIASTTATDAIRQPIFLLSREKLVRPPFFRDRSPRKIDLHSLLSSSPSSPLSSRHRQNRPPPPSPPHPPFEAAGPAKKKKERKWWFIPTIFLSTRSIRRALWLGTTTCKVMLSLETPFALLTLALFLKQEKTPFLEMPILQVRF